MKKYIFILFPLTIIFSCTSTPSIPEVSINKPWEYIGTTEHFIPSSSLSVVVESDFPFSDGDNQLINSDIRNDIEQYFHRKGYAIDPTDGGTISIDVTIKEVEKSYTNFYSSTSNFSMNYNSLQSIGVLASNIYTAHQANILQSNFSGNSTRLSASDITVFRYYITIEYQNPLGEKLFEGYSTWDSEILSPVNSLSTQLISMLSIFPAQIDYVTIPEIRDTHVGIFYELEIYKRMFICPALPHPVYFTPPFTTEGSSVPYNRLESEYTALGPVLLAVYDLISNSEAALPLYHREDLSIIDADLWREIRLGGQYFIGDSEEPVYLLVDLKGEEYGYRISSINLVTEDNYNEYLHSLDNWIIELRDYLTYFDSINQ